MLHCARDYSYTNPCMPPRYPLMHPHAFCAPCLRVCACGAWTSTLAFGGVHFAVARGIARGNAKRRIGAEVIGMYAGGKLWSSSALGSRPKSVSKYWTSLSGAKFRGRVLRKVLKCGKRSQPQPAPDYKARAGRMVRALGRPRASADKHEARRLHVRGDALGVKE